MNRPTAAAFATLTALQVLTGGALIGDVFGPRVAGGAVLVVAALQAGLAYYVNYATTPNRQVAAEKLPSGQVVAGDASPLPTGEPVKVVPPTDT